MVKPPKNRIKSNKNNKSQRSDIMRYLQKKHDPKVIHKHKRRQTTHYKG